MSRSYREEAGHGGRPVFHRLGIYMGRKLNLLIRTFLLLFLLQFDIVAQKVVGTLSTKAGTITYSEGKPDLFTTRRRNSHVTSLQPGDRLQTHTRDRIEIELNPGSYLRISGKAQLVIVETALHKMHFQIEEGIVIIESDTFDKEHHSLRLSNRSGDFKISRKGLYRFEVNESGKVEVLVHKGGLEWWRGLRKIATLQSGKQYQFVGLDDNNPQQSSLSGRKRDSIDEWSRKRSDYLKGGPFGKGFRRGSFPGS